MWTAAQIDKVTLPIEGQVFIGRDTFQYLYLVLFTHAFKQGNRIVS